MDFANDIPYDLAYRAHSGSSFVPEKRAEQERAEYARVLEADYQHLAKFADTDEKRQLLDEEFARYRAGYRKRVLARLSARTRCMSTMIAGPSNFPVRQQEKRSETAHRRLEEQIAFRKRAMEAIRKKLAPPPRPIMSGDDDAIERLEAKIAKAEKLQGIMREANRIVRRKPKDELTDEKRAQLVELGVPERKVAELFEPDYMGRMGFPNYLLTNNNANIRRMKSRLEGLRRNKAAEATEQEGDGVRMEDAPADNRVRLFFDDKPPAEVRKRLKSSGFRWAPSLGCWQAYRNTHTLAVASEFVSRG